MKKVVCFLLVVIIPLCFINCEKKKIPEPVTEKKEIIKKETPTPEESRQARIYFEKGDEYFRNGELDLAMAEFETALNLDPLRYPIWREIGNVHLAKENYFEALENYNEAVRLLELSTDESEYDKDDVKVFAKRAEVYFTLGNYIEAEADYTRAINSDESNYIYWNRRGETYRIKGDYESAIFDLTKAVSINNNEVNALNNLAIVYFNLGDFYKAIENFNKVIEINPYHASAWNNRGSSYLELEQFDKAISDYNHLINMKPNYDLAIAYNNRSRAYLGKNEFKKALEDCENALRINKNYTPALSNRGNIYREMGENKNAVSSYIECLKKTDQSNNINDISVYAWYLAGQVYNRFDYLSDDIKNDKFWSEFSGRNLVLSGIEKGIKNAEKIRQNMGIQGAALMNQMLYLYYTGVDFEAVFGSQENVFLYSESLRSRGFLEQVGTEAAIRLSGVTDSERNEFFNLKKTIDQQQIIINSYSNKKLDSAASKRYSAAIKKRKDAEKKLAALDNKLSKRIDEYSELRNPKPVTLNQAKSFCGDDRVVLEYVIWDGSEYKPIKGFESWDLKNAKPNINSYCLVISKNGVEAVKLKSNVDYKTPLENIHSKMNEKKYWHEYEDSRNELYDYLVKPILKHIKDVKNITIVPDGNIALVPFDMLRESRDEKMFGEDHVITLSPSLSVSILVSKRNKNTNNSSVMFFANDIYDEKKYPTTKKNWGNLNGVKDEIKLLEDMMIEKDISYKKEFREEATEEKIVLLSKNNELNKHSIIHFACHGYYNKDNPSESGLLLYQFGNDGVLSVSDVTALDINADIVILSACEAGMGKAVPGDGMIGLVRAFMIAGAKNVGVSLWEIDDNATVPFMKELYTKVLVNEKSFSNAYKEVKDMFKEQKIVYENLISSANPRLWAPFTMYE